MHFTREPVVETVITAKEGFRLVVRGSKGSSQEEFFVDAVEIVSFGNHSFFRSLEKPKSFLVPVNDYEVFEVRESRMILKTGGQERGIKIGGGREAHLKAVKEELVTALSSEKYASERMAEDAPSGADQKIEKKRERRRRKRRGKEEYEEEAVTPEAEAEMALFEADMTTSVATTTPLTSPPSIERPSGLIPPPTTLISETLLRYKAPLPPEERFKESQEKKILVDLPPPLVTHSQEEFSHDDEDVND